MANNSLDRVIRHVRSLVGAQSDQADGELLRAFSAGADQAAFAALTKRHGPLVLAVCRRVLHQREDAEDAFQATFIVLARQAPSLSKKGSLGGWLHRVAYRIALDARRADARRRKHERRSHAVSPTNPALQAAWREMQIYLDEEIQRLPEKYREPFILCCLESQSCAAVARRLSLKEATIWSRLAEARKRLQKRLSRRGVELTAVLGAAALAPDPIVAAALVTKVVSAAALPAGVISERVAFLVHGMTRCLMLQKAKLGVVVFLAVSAMVGGAGAFQLSRAEDKNPVMAPVAKTQAEAPAKKAILTGQYGDALPEGAVARLGTIRLRHGGIILSVVFAPDGKSLASAGTGGTVHVWDATTGKEKFRIENEEFPDAGGSVEQLAYTPDGKTLAGTRMNQPPCLWDLATGKELRRFGGMNYRARWLAMSPDGKTLAFGGWQDDPKIRVADASTGKDQGECRGKWLVFSPDSKTLAYGGGKDDSSVHLAEVHSGKEMRKLDGYKQSSSRAAFSPDGAILASVDDHTVRLFEFATGRTREVPQAGGKTQSFKSLTFSPDGKMLAATSSSGGLVQVIEVATAKAVWKNELTGEHGAVWSILFTPDNQTVISNHGDGFVRFWDAGTGAKTNEFRAHSDAASRLAISPGGKTLATTAWSPAGGDYSVRLWETTTGHPIALPLGPQSGISFLAFSHDGRRVATGNFDVPVQIWESATGKLLFQWKVYGPIAFTPDGQSLLCGGARDGNVHFFNIATGKETRNFQAHKKRIHFMDMSRDGKILATTGGDKIIRVWDLATRRQFQDFSGEQMEGVRNLVLTPNGKLLAIVVNGNVGGKSIQILDTTTGKVIREYPEPQFWSNSIGFSNDGKLMASIFVGVAPQQGYFVRLRDVATGKETRQVSVGWTPVDTVAFSPDGRTLICGGQFSRSLQYLEVATGGLRRNFNGHQGNLSRVAFAPTGRVMASGSADGSVLIWDATGDRGRQKGSKPLGAAQLNKLWSDLAAPDAPTGYQAICTLRASPVQCVQLFEKQIKPVPRAGAKRLANALRDLDSPQFAIRSEATKELETFGEAAQSALRQLLTEKPSLEVRQRVEKLLDRFGGVHQLRQGRAFEVLEHIGSPEAKTLLETLARGAPGARQTEEARASLERLAARAAKY